MESLPLFVVLHVYVLLGKLYICCVFMLLYTCNIHLTFFSLSPPYCTHKYRKSASCTHVSAALHALSSLKPVSFSLQPNLLPASSSEDDAMDTPCTSLPCQWKPPKKRKESTLRLYEASFVKHDYAKPSKRKVRCIEEYDPRPPAFRGSTAQRLPALLQQLKGQQLCISILFDPECRQDTVQNPGSHKLPSKAVLSETISAFKRVLKSLMMLHVKLKDQHVNNSFLCSGFHLENIGLQPQSLELFFHDDPQQLPTASFSELFSLRTSVRQLLYTVLRMKESR